MNRQQRRKMSAQHKVTAALLARCCFDYDPEGNLIAVKHPRAVALLDKAFSVMLQNNLEPHVIQISQKDARTFPRGDSKKAPDECPSWLGVAVDVAGRGTYSLRYCRVPGAPAALEKQIAIAETKMHLSEHSRTAGFPAQYACAGDTGGVND